MADFDVRVAKCSEPSDRDAIEKQLQEFRFQGFRVGVSVSPHVTQERYLTFTFGTL